MRAPWGITEESWKFLVLKDNEQQNVPWWSDMVPHKFIGLPDVYLQYRIPVFRQVHLMDFSNLNTFLNQAGFAG